MLDDLGTRGRGRVRQIFANPTTFLHHPESLHKLVQQVDAITWHEVGRERLGDVYEGLLQKNASEKKSGAGQYFTPRPLIETIVKVLQPQPGELIVDPAAGTGGFFVCANAYIRSNALQKERDVSNTHFFGVELVRDTHRLALMNAMLHKVGGEIALGDALAADGVDLPFADLIITNPPFGNKRGAGRAMRADLKFPTSNKQLAFLQLIYHRLKSGGRAAVVLPDNVLFEDGLASKIRGDLMEQCSLHTILRLPTGIFYAQGVRTNVLFFTRGTSKSSSTRATWIYDLRTNLPVFGKRTPLMHDHFADFIKCYGPRCDGTSARVDQGEEGRFRVFTRDDIASRGNNLDISWLEQTTSSDRVDLPSEPLEIIDAIRERLQLAIDDLESIAASFDGEEVEP